MADTMSHFRKIYEDLPASISVPAELRHRRVEVLLLPLDLEQLQENQANADELGWPRGFFERTAGRWAGEQLRRESPGEYETRDGLD